MTLWIPACAGMTKIGSSPRRSHRSEQELNIALRAGDRAALDPPPLPARLLPHPARPSPAHPFVPRRVPPRPSLADLAPPGFELRLDQRDQSRLGLCES